MRRATINRVVLAGRRFDPGLSWRVVARLESGKEFVECVAMFDGRLVAG